MQIFCVSKTAINYSYPSVETYVLTAQKNRLIETALLSTHNICFDSEIRKIDFEFPSLI